MDGFFVGATLATEMMKGMLFASVCFVLSIFVTTHVFDFGNNGLWFPFYSFLIARAFAGYMQVRGPAIDSKSCLSLASPHPLALCVVQWGAIRKKVQRNSQVHLRSLTPDYGTTAKTSP